MTMKKIFAITAVLLVFKAVSFAGEKEVLIGLHGGLYYQKTACAMLEFDFERKYHNVWSVYADLTNRPGYCEVDQTYFCTETFWDYQTLALGVAYKHEIVRRRNLNLRARIGVDAGTECRHRVNEYGFCMSAEVGFELSWVFKNRVRLCVSQRNDFCFFTEKHFKNGIMIGLKLPLN